MVNPILQWMDIFRRLPGLLCFWKVRDAETSLKDELAAILFSIQHGVRSYLIIPNSTDHSSARLHAEGGILAWGRLWRVDLSSYLERV
jgi:hypothetical protein